MSDAAELDPAEDEAVEPDEEENSGPPSRDRDLLGASTSKIRTKLDELFSAVARGYEDQSERADAIDDYWDCFNCVINGNQYYNGIAQIYFPIIHDAVVARSTRFGNQMCPDVGRYIEAVTTDGTTPTAIIALLEHYLRSKMFETQVLKPLLRNGDIEGQYNLLVDWGEVRRLIVSRETHGPRIKDESGEEVEAPGDDIEDVREDEVIEGSPTFEVVHDSDVLVQPATADSIEEALQSGGSVTIVPGAGRRRRSTRRSTMGSSARPRGRSSRPRWTRCATAPAGRISRRASPSMSGSRRRAARRRSG